MKKLLFLLVMIYGSVVQAQTLVTRNGYIGFFSKTPLENIKAESSQAMAAIDPVKKTLAFAVLIKGFLFEKALMQEHFNENYIESDKFPKATFSGTFAPAVDLSKPGTYAVMVSGPLTLHGVTKNIEVPGTFVVQEGSFTSKASFNLKPQDFNIQIPALVREKIAQQISVSVQADFKLSN